MNEWYGDGDNGSQMRTEVRRHQVKQNLARDRLLRSSRNAMRDADDQLMIERLEEDDKNELTVYEKMRPVHMGVIVDIHMVMVGQMVELQALRHAFEQAHRWGATTEDLYSEASKILHALKFDDNWQNGNAEFWHGWTLSADEKRQFLFSYPTLKTAASVRPDELDTMRQKITNDLETRWPVPAAEISQDELDKKANSLYGTRTSFGQWAYEWAKELHTQRSAFVGALKDLAARDASQEEAIIASIDATIIEGYHAHLGEVVDLHSKIVHQIKENRTPYRTGLTPETSLNSVSYENNHLPSRDYWAEKERRQQSDYLAAQLKELELRKSRSLLGRLKNAFK